MERDELIKGIEEWYKNYPDHALNNQPLKIVMTSAQAKRFEDIISGLNKDKVDVVIMDDVPKNSLIEYERDMKEVMLTNPYHNLHFDSSFNKVEQYIRSDPKVNRNDPCTCGSRKKYKKCCGK